MRVYIGVYAYIHLSASVSLRVCVDMVIVYKCMNMDVCVQYYQKES